MFLFTLIPPLYHIYLSHVCKSNYPDIAWYLTQKLLKQGYVVHGLKKFYSQSSHAYRQVWDIRLTAEKQSFSCDAAE